MDNLLVSWSVDPVAFHWAGRSIHWYGILFMCGYMVAYTMFERIMLREGRPVTECWQVLVGMVIATFVGGRLGHCFFYNANFYLAHPVEIVAVWRGGFSSHGVVVSSILFLIAWCRWNRVSMLWISDRICVCIPVVAACVRLGNFANSEIVGIPTDGSWGVIFTRVDSIARHPVVLYEAIANFSVFGLMCWLYFRTSAGRTAGRLWGVFFIALFGLRFVLESFKDSPNVSWGSLSLTMGQWLSVPCVVAGGLLIAWPSIRRLVAPTEAKSHYINAASSV